MNDRLIRLQPALALALLTLCASAQAQAPLNTSFTTALNFQADALSPPSDTERIVQGGPVGSIFYYTFGVASAGTLLAGLNYSSSGFQTGTLNLYTAAHAPLSSLTSPLAVGVYYLAMTVTGDVNGGTYGDGSAGNSAFQLTYGGTTPSGTFSSGYAYVVPATAAVPETSPAWLLLAGLAPLGMIAARRRA